MQIFTTLPRRHDADVVLRQDFAAAALMPPRRHAAQR